MTTELKEMQETQGREGTYITPRANIVEYPETVVLEIELPGAPKDAVDLEIKDNELTITGRRHRPEESGRLRLRERPVADFRRVFGLSRAIDTEHVEAEMHEGLLKVTLHKRESMKPKHITIT